jgi:hypothetical protein
MKLRKGLGLSAAALMWSCWASGAGAAPTDARVHTLDYSAQSVAVNGNKVVIPTSALNFILALRGGTTADTVTIFAPPGATFAGTAGVPGFFGCGPAVTAGNATNNFATNNVTGTDIVTTGAFAPATCQTGDQVSFLNATNTGLTLSNVADLATPGRQITIYAQYSNGAFFSDSTRFPLVTLIAGNTLQFQAVATAPPLGIDLTGTGGSTPGAQFSNGTGGVNPTGFLGTISLGETQQLDAATGAPLAAPLALVTNAAGNVTVSGNFQSITGAFLVLNGNRASCAGPAPAGAITGTVTTTQTQITFPTGPGGPPNVSPPATFAPSVNSWAVCIITAGGAQQIQPTTTTISAAAQVTGATLTQLTAGSLPYGAIVNNGTVAFFQQVFFTQNGYTSFLRTVNPNTSPASVFFQLAVGVGPAPGTVFNGTALTALAANTGVYLTANQLATIVGFTPGNTPANGTATVKLMSPAQNIQFSNLSINPTSLDLSSLP